ncbi:MAG: DEAD/DEAH box helicase, partial [Myxococcota bacterium]
MPTPTDFATLPLPAPLLRAVTELGYPGMTEIQARTLPGLLAGGDLVARSRTGSGKTVAFALPLLARVDLARRRPQALVLCPTRELGAQVAATIRTLGRHLPGLRVLLVSGGQPGGPQRRALEEGVHVLVGTPGRVRDHVERGSLDPHHIRVAVLDEADRMLDMGFQEDVELILAGLPDERQTLFFSATYPRSIEEMSATWQRDPAHVVVEDPVEEAPTLRQVACVTEDRESVLVALCQSHGPTLVFANFKASAAALCDTLRGAGLAAAYLGGDLEQRDRDRILAQLRNRSIQVLVATDVAARGLDVDDLALVVNAELPPKPEV